VAVSPNFTEDSIVFAGTDGDGVFCSSDRGATWAAWNFGLLDYGVLSIAVSPSYGTDETLFVGTSSGLFRSQNGGRAWREIELPVINTAVLSLAVSPTFTDDGLIFVGTEGAGLFRSVDGGECWSAVGDGILGDTINVIAFAPMFGVNRHVFVATDKGTYYSGDRGQTWETWAEITTVLGLAIPPRWSVGERVLVALSGGGVRWLPKA
jgi:photosystem II stability/assembly factor-like uncharacterized protein